MSQSQKPSDGLLARVRERRRARRQQALERQYHQREQDSQGIDVANKTAGYSAAYGAEGSDIRAGLDGAGGGGA